MKYISVIQRKQQKWGEGGGRGWWWEGGGEEEEKEVSVLKRLATNYNQPQAGTTKNKSK